MKRLAVVALLVAMAACYTRFRPAPLTDLMEPSIAQLVGQLATSKL